MSSDTLEVRTGRLATIFPLFDPFTIKHAHEIMALRPVMRNLHNETLWTADFAMYRVENGEVFLYFAPREYNLIFRDFENAIGDLRKSVGGYIPPKEGVDEIVAAASEGKVLKVKVSDLQLQKNEIVHMDYNFRHFDVDPDKLDSLNPAQRSLVKAIYGDSRSGYKVFILNPEYVKEHLKGKEDLAVARACWLASTHGNSYFGTTDTVFTESTIDYQVGHRFMGLLGVLTDAAKAQEADLPAVQSLTTPPPSNVKYIRDFLRRRKK